ncbi:MAG: SDR family oxidoreductase, partial [Rhodobacteraceae bacterium]|nr:SDR family oxidoreductase [Paracoccaceae bacterium]
MHVAGKIAVVTGAARGIGRAIAEALIAHGAKVAICDLNIDAVSKTAQDIGALPLQCDVTRATDITAMIDAVERDLGSIDIFVSNAGIIGGDPTHAASAPDAVWQKAWDIHVMAHVWAAQRLLPAMIERRSGYMINIASAAGLLNQIGDAPYSATK